MIGEFEIESATDKLHRLGPAGNLDPEQLCTLIGVDYESVKDAASTSATHAMLAMLRNIDPSGGIDGNDVFGLLATEHMLGFLTGVVAHHASLGEPHPMM